MWETLLAGSFPSSHSHHLCNTCPGVVLPTVGWAPSRELAIKKTPIREREPLSWGFFFPGFSSLPAVTKSNRQNILNYWENAKENCLERLDLTSGRMAIIWKTTDTAVCGKEECNGCSCQGIQNGCLLGKLKIKSPCDLAISVLVVYSKGSISYHRDACLHMHAHCCSVQRRKWSQPVCPSIKEWMMEYMALRDLFMFEKRN